MTKCVMAVWDDGILADGTDGQPILRVELWCLVLGGDKEEERVE